MQNISTPSGFLTQEEFTQYAANWLNLVSQAESPALPGSFEAEAGARVAYVSFPIMRVAELVSAVGAKQIKARFVLIPDGGQQKFSLVLFAADDTQQPEGRKSAYYLAQPWWTQSTAPVLGEPVPDNLATLWVDSWKGASAVTTDMFATPAGPLEGYNFDLKDFVKPLFTDQAYGQQEIRLWLGLHTYYSPTNLNSPTQTFGLVARRFDPTQAVQQGQPVTDESFYDLSTPCPPIR
ncbi:hypothetical protein [Hymenobacter properus]|uniref:Uncharacterized protein n=1 Tax=Hymenobacter properus TaxID=2791026 RepID=A0A931BJ11_9BACT|nr:hypothetical protein [Hymenobacter properus]MBF9141093.1 hypothetical protein [Hymenobacter properus]MBR7719902.1 hypothetical protein [Microvirga sp. SRT04]